MRDRHRDVMGSGTSATTARIPRLCPEMVAGKYGFRFPLPSPSTSAWSGSACLLDVFHGDGVLCYVFKLESLFSLRGKKSVTLNAAFSLKK